MLFLHPGSRTLLLITGLETLKSYKNTNIILFSVTTHKPINLQINNKNHINSGALTIIITCASDVTEKIQ